MRSCGAASATASWCAERSFLLAVFLWFLALSFALVLLVFDSAALDYRLIMAGSLLPYVDYLWGGPWVLHSVLFPVALMIAVMLIGWGRRLVQRRWLGLPIGVFLHQVLAATWTSERLFWWPAFGLDLDGAEPSVPPAALAVVLELAGAAVFVWLYRFLGLDDAGRRERFTRTGQVDRSRLR